MRLPTFYVHAGRALHALQDSFTHTLRDPSDLRRIVSVLNWVDEVGEGRVGSRDGAPHISALDDCNSTDARVRERYDLAAEASEDLLRALLEPEGDTDRSARIGAVLDTYLQMKDGCDAANGWCNAPELELQQKTGGCSVASHSKSFQALAFTLIALGWRRRRAHIKLSRGAPRRRYSSSLSVVLILTTVVLIVARAKAQDADAHVRSEDRGPSQADDAVLVPSGPGSSGPGSSGLGSPGPGSSGLGASLRVGGSIDHGAFAVDLGARYAISSDWWLGVDVEWNPWFSFATLRTRPGALNIFVPVVWRWHHDEPLSLRTTWRVGVSVLLFDLVGAPSGNVGPCLGMNLLGIDVPLTSHLRFVIDPAEVFVAVPQVEGAPIVYVQYRLALGLLYF